MQALNSLDDRELTEEGTGRSEIWIESNAFKYN